MTTGTCEIDNFLRSERAAWQSVDVKGKSNWTWYSAAFGLVVAALVTSASFYAVFASIGETWAGFPIERSGKVGLRIFSSPAAAPSLPMFAERGRIIGISGHPVRDGVEARSFIRSQAPGTPLRYLAEEPGGRQFEFTISTEIFDTKIAYEYWSPVLGAGVVFLAMMSIPIFARPDLLATRALYATGLGVAVSGCLSFPAIFLDDRMGSWTDLFYWVGVAGAWNFAFFFPLARGQARARPNLIRGAVWLCAVSLYGLDLSGLAGVLGLEPMEFLAVILWIAGYFLLLINLGIAALDAEHPVMRREARAVFVGPLLCIVLAGCGAVVGTSSVESFTDPLFFFSPMLVFSGSIGFGIMRANLFGLGASSRRVAARVALLLSAISAFYLVFAMGIFFFETGTALGLTSIIFLCATIVSFVWPRAFRQVERFLELIVLPEKKRSRQALEQAAAEIARLRDPESLAAFLQGTIRDALGVPWVRCVVQTPEANLSVPGGEPADVRIPKGSPLHREILQGRSLTTHVGSAQPDELREAVLQSRSLGAALVVPLLGPPGFCGAVLCGNIESGEPFSVADISLVQLLGSSASVAFENAKAWQEVEHLRERLERENHILRAEVQRDVEMGEMVGQSAALRHAVHQIQQVAPTDASALVVGETGVGKELAVRMLHRFSRRSDRILVKMACAALPESLLESELFGHERGAFTGAEQERAGRFEVADGGTLFFDDVDTLPLGVQAKLLRAIQEGEVQRLGTNKVQKVDVRIVAATNIDLLAAVRAGRFRQDLYYRLNVVPVHLPPLRERLEDIPSLVEHFIKSSGEGMNRTNIEEISISALDEMAAYAWPGNLRELRNVVERAMVLTDGKVLHLPDGLGRRKSSRKSFATRPVARETEPLEAEVSSSPVGSASMKELLREYKKRLVLEALASSGGNQARAAELLGVHRSNLNRSIRDLGIRIS